MIKLYFVSCFYYSKSVKYRMDCTGGETHGSVSYTHLDVYKRQVYAAQTAPLIDYYQSKGVMSSIDGSKSMEDVLAAIRVALGSN